MGRVVVPAHGWVGGGDGPRVTADHEGHPDVGEGGLFGHFLEARLQVGDGFIELWVELLAFYSDVG